MSPSIQRLAQARRSGNPEPQRASGDVAGSGPGPGTAADPPPASLPPQTGDNSPEGLRYLFEVTKSEVDTQFQIAERLDSKAKGLFTITAAIFAAAQALALRPDVLDRLGPGRDTVITISIIAGGLVALALLATAFALWVRNDSSVESKPLFGWLNGLDAGTQTEREVALRIVEAYITLLEKRRAANERRAGDVAIVQVLCVLGIGASVLQLVLALGGLS